MNTGINNTKNEHRYYESISSTQKESNKNDIFSTPVKCNKVRCIDEAQENISNSSGGDRNFPRRYMNFSNCDMIPKEGMIFSKSPGLSPFSKHCANLSPLYKDAKFALKGLNSQISSKFSVEFMKSPNVKIIHHDNCASQENETPTFNSKDEEIIVRKFSFLEDKENIDANRKSDQPNDNLQLAKSEFCPLSEHNRDSIQVQSQMKISINREIVNIKSRGSTSSDSNGLCKNEVKDSRIKESNFIHECKEDNKESNILKFNKRDSKAILKKTQEQMSISDTKVKDEKGCNCKKSQCKKLYCECFLSQRSCTSACSCFSCCNTPENEQLISNIRSAMIHKNPLAFQEKFTMVNQNASTFTENRAVAIHSRGCKCKKSKCQTGYCECHQIGAKCSDLCKCEGCENPPDESQSDHQDK